MYISGTEHCNIEYCNASENLGNVDVSYLEVGISIEPILKK